MVGVKRQRRQTVRRDPRRYQRTQGVVHPLLGRDFLGRQYISTELPWVREEDGDAVIDVDGARADGVSVTLEGDAIVLRW